MKRPNKQIGVIHFYAGSDYPEYTIHDYASTLKAIDEQQPFIATTQMGLLTRAADMTDGGCFNHIRYTIVIHSMNNDTEGPICITRSLVSDDDTGDVYIAQVYNILPAGTTEREIRVGHDLYALWRHGEFTFPKWDSSFTREQSQEQIDFVHKQMTTIQ